MAGGMTRGITVHGIIHGTVLIGIVRTIGAITAGAGVDFTADGTRRGIMTGIGAHHGDGVTGTEVNMAVMDIIITMITTILTIATSMDAQHHTAALVRRRAARATRLIAGLREREPVLPL